MIFGARQPAVPVSVRRDAAAETVVAARSGEMMTGVRMAVRLALSA
jgi:hypothetical protein